MTTTIPLTQVMEVGQSILDGKVRGRIVVEIG
jgi:acrylyl-CoA reductase (NADPH)